MKRIKTLNFRRLLTVCLSCFVICNTTLNAMANEPELNERTIVICDQEGNITYENFENSIVPYAENITENGLVITPGHDDGYTGDTSLQFDVDNDSLISPLANTTTLVPIGTTTIYPYKTFCRIESIFPDNESIITSGVLVHHNLVLTSAHAVYQHDHGGFASYTLVYPGYNVAEHNKPIQPYGSANVTYRRLLSGYVDTRNPEYDWALLDLDREFDTYHSFGYAQDYTQLTGRSVTAYGYPEGWSQMHSITGPIKQSFERLLHISIQTHQGQSGGPVVDDITDAVIGIVQGHDYNIFGTYLYNKSVRIDEFLYNYINSLK